MKLDSGDGDSNGLSDFVMVDDALHEIPKTCCRGTFQDVGSSRLAHML